MIKVCKSCPYGNTVESAYAEMTGCLPSRKEVKELRTKHRLTWECHSREDVPCQGAIDLLQDVGEDAIVITLVSECYEWGSLLLDDS